jgi:HEAT repeat protein
MNLILLMKGGSWIRITGLVTIIVASTIFLLTRSQGIVTNDQLTATGDDAVNKAIQGLWSPRDSDRAGSKDQILQLGPQSITALIKLIDDLADKPGPRFATGKEEEGRRLWDRVQSSIDKLDAHTWNALNEVEISSRLYKDALELLGKLRAEEAVPLVVRLMSTDTQVLSKKHSEMQTLVQIGNAAIAKLLEILETPDETLASDSYWLGPDHEYIRGPRNFRFVPRFIKSRAAMVLGQIGDPRVLPELESALQRATDRDLIESLRDAIRRLSRPH